MSEKMPRSGAIEGHVDSSGSYQHRIGYDDRTSPSFGSLVSEIMNLFAAPDSKRHELECMLSTYMKPEGDFACSERMLLYSKTKSSGNQIIEKGPRRLQLKILNSICEPVFTGVPIKGKNSQPVMVALVDVESGDIVTVGPEALARVEIVALDPDLGGCLGEDWTPEEFKNKIVTEEGNKRLLTGKLVLDLKDGIGYAGPFQFSHTKTWKTLHAYSLGVIAVGDDLQSKIREGFTGSFFVRDRRLIDSNQKHHPPTLSDEVWRLDSIAKDGAFHKRLREKEVNINKVEDLLKMLNTDPQKLRNILGKGMSPRLWEALVDHARTCVVDKALYFYSSSECSQSSVIFNMVGQVMGLLSESQYLTFEILSESQKAHAMKLVATAFQQWDKVVPFDDEASFSKSLGTIENVSPITESSSGITISIPQKSSELDLPQPAISFEDKASVFDESPVIPPKSPTMESSSGTKMIISPKICKLGFFNPAVSSGDNKFFFDESPIKESSNAIVSLISQENELYFPPPAFSYDEDTNLFDETPGTSNVFCSPKTSCNNLISAEIDELDIPQPFVPSQEIIPSCDSVWEMSYYNDCSLESSDLENTFHQHVRNSSFSSQMTDSDNWEMDSMIQPFWGENQDFPLQFSVEVDDASVHPQGLPLESLDISQSNGNLPLVNARKRYLHNKAKRKWRVLFSVIRWLFVPRKSVGELLDQHMKIKLSSSYQDLQALVETKSSQLLDLNSEANLHSAVNDVLLARSFAVATNIAQRKYMPKREKARRRWTKLYSVMKWFLLQRKVIQRASTALITRGPSCLSSSDDMLSVLARDMCPNQWSSGTFPCPFHEDEYMQMFNTICSLQPRNRIAMNKLARRRNIADRDFAKKKWRMLFSIMKWLSVRRSAAGVKH